MSSALLCPPAAVALPGSEPLLPVVGAATRVPLVTGGSVRYVDLDSAASSQAAAAEGSGAPEP